MQPRAEYTKYKQIQANTKYYTKNTKIQTKYNRNTDIIEIDEIRGVSGTGVLSFKLTICPYIGSQKKHNEYKKKDKQYKNTAKMIHTVNTCVPGPI